MKTDVPTSGWKRLALLIVVSTVIAVILVALIITFITRDTRRDLSLSEVVKSASKSEGDVANILGDLRDRTTGLCSEEPGCIEGFQSASVDLLRFSSEDQAEAFAASNTDRHLSGWIVLAYRGDALSIEERSKTEAFLDGLWSSE